jgi:hypothetical protein
MLPTTENQNVSLAAPSTNRQVRQRAKKARTDSVAEGKIIKKEQDSNEVANYINATLMMANAAQIREVIDIGKEQHYFYWFVLSLLSVSVFLQLCSAILMLFTCTCSGSGSGADMEKGQDCEAETRKKNSNILGFISLFTVVANILIVGFTPSPPDDRLLNMLNSTAIYV